MAIVVDTSLALAVYDADDDLHAIAAAWLASVDDELVTTPLTIAELDHHLGRLSRDALEAFYDDLDRGAWIVRWWADAMAESVAIARRRPDVGLADASLVALARRMRTDRIATFDHHHFRTLTTDDGRPLVLLPTDSS
ncbi:MAG: PIN domain-containing protein [Solirubrobacteraceae bacterium]|nr:PIN domain-containing protein [Solirubrobacteraceae bacterium]